MTGSLKRMVMFMWMMVACVGFSMASFAQEANVETIIKDNVVYFAVESSAVAYGFDDAEKGNKTTKLVIEAEINGVPVTKVGNFIKYTNLKEVVLPPTITDIAENAFYGCTKLKKINFPEGLARIGHHAFSDCSSLKEIKLPQSLTDIGELPFLRESKPLAGIFSKTARLSRK